MEKFIHLLIICQTLMSIWWSWLTKPRQPALSPRAAHFCLCLFMFSGSQCVGNSLCEGEALSQRDAPSMGSIPWRVLPCTFPCLGHLVWKIQKQKCGLGRSVRLADCLREEQQPILRDQFSMLFCTCKSPRTPGRICQCISLASHGSSEHFLAHWLEVLSTWYLEAARSWEFLHMPSLF